jgi:hypothetical protein
MSMRSSPKTDIGTVLVHLVLIVSFVVALGTGLRIASDDPDAAWLSILDPVLPMEHLWFRHLIAGVAMTGALAGYAVYVVRARLAARIRFDISRAKAIWRGGQTGVSALNVVVVWLLLLGLTFEAVTGAAIFLDDAGQTLIALHHWVSWLCLACVVAHVGLHVTYGGARYALKIFRPGRLRIAPPPPDLAELLAEELRRRTAPPVDHDASSSLQEPSLRAHPLATAVAVALMVAGIACGSETLTRPVLTVVAIPKSEAPIVDGDVSDPVWSKARPVTVTATQGGDFGGTHQSRIEIRALHDGEFAYFVFTWDDPTRSLKHHPLVKTQDGWRVASSRPDLVDEDVYHEDKFAVLLSPSAFPIIGAAIHLSVRPLQGKPAGSTGRGLHYTLDGSILDVWQWRATHEGADGHIDNCHFGGPREASAVAPTAPYSGGFALDPGPRRYEKNVAGGTTSAAIHPRRLPKDLVAMTQAMGRMSDATNESESENARWWMSVAESVPFTTEGDATIPVGTVIPGVLVLEKPHKDKNEIIGFGRWAAGRWTLEVVRRLKTDSTYDVELKTGVLMWVAAFDHSEKRHARHLRPFRLKVE